MAENSAAATASGGKHAKQVQEIATAVSKKKDAQARLDAVIDLTVKNMLTMKHDGSTVADFQEALAHLYDHRAELLALIKDGPAA